MKNIFQAILVSFLCSLTLQARKQTILTLNFLNYDKERDIAFSISSNDQPEFLPEKTIKMPKETLENVRILPGKKTITIDTSTISDNLNLTVSIPAKKLIGKEYIQKFIPIFKAPFSPNEKLPVKPLEEPNIATQKLSVSPEDTIDITLFTKNIVFEKK